MSENDRKITDALINAFKDSEKGNNKNVKRKIPVSELELARITSENFEKLYEVKLSESDTKATGIEITDYKIDKIMDKEFSN